MASTTRLEGQVSEALRGAGLSGSGAALVVAVSGGPDSTALLLSLAALRGAHGLTLYAAHAEQHDFRGEEAFGDSAFVTELAQGLGVPLATEKQDTMAYQNRKGISSFEQAARELRYSFLGREALRLGAHAVAVGHNADDQAETVLLHVLRGSGVHGLRAMTEVADWPWPGGDGIVLFRPLLGTPKSATAEYCRQRGVSYREDSGNLLSRFTRNRIRRDLLPALAQEYNPQVREALVRLSRSAAEELDFVEGELARVWPEVAVEVSGEVRFSRSVLMALHPALRRLTLRRGYAAVAGDPRRLHEAHLSAMMNLTKGEKGGGGLDLPRGVVFRKANGELVLSKDGAPVSPFPDMRGGHSLRFPENSGVLEEAPSGPWRVTMCVGDSAGSPTPDKGLLSVCLDRASMGEEGVLRTWQPGDRMQPAGMQGHKKLQDIFTDAKVPRAWRPSVPVLECRRGIAWVAGIRTAEWARPNPHNQPTLRITLTPQS